MATETAPKIENPNTSDLNVTPPATEDVPSTVPPPSSGVPEGKPVAEKTKAAEDSGDVQKKMKRAERFGVPVKLSEEEKRNSRAERFGTGSAVNGSDSSKSAEELKRKARGERFGTVQSEPAEEEAKKKARVAKFGSSPQADPVEEEKKKARAIRFSQPDSGSKLNGKENIEAKTAVVGKAGGEET